MSSRPVNSSEIVMATKSTIIDEDDEEVIEQQTRLYIIIITSFFLFFFSIVGYVFYNQWKRVREQNREKYKASEIEKEGKPMLSRKESVIGQGQKVVVIERRLSRMKRASPDDDDPEAEKKMSTNSAPCLSNDTAKTYYKMRNDHPNQPVMIRYTNGISSKFIKDIGDFNSIGEAENIHRSPIFSPIHTSHPGMFSPPCGLYNPIKVPFSNCNAMRIHALQNEGFASSSHGSPHISCEIFPSNTNGQGENCQVKYQHVHLDDKSSSTEASDHYQLHNDFCRSMCNCNQILTIPKTHDDNLLSVKHNIKASSKPVRKTSATQTSIQDIHMELSYSDRMMADNEDDDEEADINHNITSSGTEPLISANQKKVP